MRAASVRPHVQGFLDPEYQDVALDLQPSSAEPSLPCRLGIFQCEATTMRSAFGCAAKISRPRAYASTAGTVLGGLAEFERELIRARTGEGRQRARARGVHLGRKPKLTPHEKREALARRDAGDPLAEISRSYGVHHSTNSLLHP